MANWTNLFFCKIGTAPKLNIYDIHEKIWLIILVFIWTIFFSGNTLVANDVLAKARHFVPKPKLSLKYVILLASNTFYLSHPENLIRKPIRIKKKNLRIHPKLRSTGILGNFVFQSGQKVWQEIISKMIRSLQLVTRNEISLIQRKMSVFRMTEVGR